MKDKETILKLYNSFVNELSPPDTYKEIRNDFKKEKRNS